MDRDEYEGLIRRLEAESLSRPLAFRNKVLAISAAAYVALFATLGGIAGLLYWILVHASWRHHAAAMVKVGILALMMLPVFFVVLRMLLMRLPKPEGREIGRSEAPKLFEVIDKMRHKLRGPPIHHVLIDRDYNAAIVQRPRFGLFGGHVNYLILGLPFLLGVAPKEMLAVIGHEYGHLCGAHGKIGAWVYRQRRTLGALYEKVRDNADASFAHGLMANALVRFMPVYNAYTFVLSRQNEYEADLTAGELVGTEHSADGLLRSALSGRWFAQDYWSTFHEQADVRIKPAFQPYASMRMAFAASYSQWANEERLAEAWREDSDLLDTHPCLRDRVEAMGERKRVPPPVERTAAEALLGPFAKQLIDEFDQSWWKESKTKWETRYQYVTRAKGDLKKLSAQPLDAMPLHDLHERALLTAEFESLAAAKPVLAHLIAQPGGPFPRAEYFYGCALLAEEDENGLLHLETALNNDRAIAETAANTGYRYLRRKRGEAAADAWWNQVLPA
ncbi:MAG TPA: M48 family metallopeptidase [Usitatibacteraceae bacterium]